MKGWGGDCKDREETCKDGAEDTCRGGRKIHVGVKGCHCIKKRVDASGNHNVKMR